MARFYMTAGILALLAAPLAAQDQPTENQAAQQQQPEKSQPTLEIAGEYNIAKGRSAGEEIPKQQLDGRVIITKDLMKVYDADNNELYILQYQIGPQAEGETKGRKILMKTIRSTMPAAKGSMAQGLIKSTGDKVALIYAYGKAEVPDEYETENEAQNLFVLKPLEQVSAETEPDQ